MDDLFQDGLPQNTDQSATAFASTLAIDLFLCDLSFLAACAALSLR